MISLINVPCDSPAEYYQPAPTARRELVRNVTAKPRLKPSLSSPQLTQAQYLLRESARRARKSVSFNRMRAANTNAAKQHHSANQEWLAVFGRRRAFKQINYLRDGRKTLNGQLIESSTIPSTKLWENLLVRSFAHKMEDEIESPKCETVDCQQMKLSRLNVKNAVWQRFTVDALTKMLQKLYKDAAVIGKYLGWLSLRKPFGNASYSAANESTLA